MPPSADWIKVANVRAVLICGPLVYATTDWGRPGLATPNPSSATPCPPPKVASAVFGVTTMRCIRLFVWVFLSLLYTCTGLVPEQT